MKKYPTSIMALSTRLMRCICIPLGLLLLPLAAMSQAFDYGNAWYDPTATYVRFEVNADGIYRVTPQQLIQNGLDTAGLDPANLHVVYRGLEQHVYIHPVGAGWDYLEFFGQRNDGTLDTLLYMNPYDRTANGSGHPNPHVSNYTDKSVYYCYVDNQPGLRLVTPFLGTMPPPLLVAQYQRTSLVEVMPGQGAGFTWHGLSQADIFHAGNPFWTPGEGYEGLAFGALNDASLQIPTPHALNNGPASLRLRLAGMGSYAHAVEVTMAGHLLLRDTLFNYFVWDTTLAYPYAILGDTQTLQVHAASLQGGIITNVCYLNAAAFTYPSALDLDGAGTVAFAHSNSIQDYYKIYHIAAGVEAVSYDLLQHTRITDTIHGDSLGIWVAGSLNQGYNYLASDAAIGSPLVLPGIGSHLSDASNGADLLLITSHALANSALAYQNFRQSSLEHPLNVRIVYTDEIYNEFGYGSAHPLAIKRFIKYALDQWAVKPSYVLMWGRGKADIRLGGINHVPLYGTPPSDMLYVASYRRDTISVHAEAAIGRVPILEDQQGLDYVAKLQLYEQHADEPWERNGIFIDDANDSAVYKPIQSYLDSLRLSYLSHPHYGRKLNYGWQDSVNLESASISCDSAVNQGAGLITYFGNDHRFRDLLNPATHHNQGRLPMVMELACTLLSMETDTLSMEEKLVLAAGRGAISLMYFRGYVFLVGAGEWVKAFGDRAYHLSPNAPIGESVVLANDTLVSNFSDQVFVNHALGINLLGDPSLVMHTGSYTVWPGDADDDLLANNQDLLNIGIAYGDTGALRPNASLAWTAQSAVPWNASFATGVNYAHADCDGNGTVEAADTLAIVQNYGLAHNKTIGQLDGGPDDPALAIEAVVDSLQDSSHVNLIVRLGSVLQPADSAYGIAWSVFYDPMLVDSASVQVDFDSCWLGTVGYNLLTLQRHFHAQGRIDLAITRTDHAPISGYGELLRIGIVVIDNISGKLPGDTTLAPALFVPGEGRLVDPSGRDLPMRGLAKRLWVVGTVAEPALPTGEIAQVYPNPVRNELYVQTRSEGPCTATVTDLSGRVLLRQVLVAGLSKRIAMGSLPMGVYLLKLENADGTYQAKVMKAD